MKEILEVIVRRVGERIFRAPVQVVNLENNTWVIESEGVFLTGKLYPSPITATLLIFEVIKVQGKRELVGLEFTMETVEEAIKQAGITVFHTSPAALYVSNPEEGDTWTIEFEGIAVTGRVCPVNKDQVTFKVIKAEGKRQLVGLKFTI
ncbi:MAG: hypothetical protein PHE77_00030 [Candidatus Pacebacteria bacterium]|nr:hypothetical protein [Candidatus Paceibacterota bacterium]